MEFIMTHWASILVALAFIVVVVILAVRGKKEVICKILYALITEAEERYGKGEGKIKFAEVMTAIYDRLPAIIRIFITYNTLEKWIEDTLKKAKADWAKKAGITENKTSIGFSE